MPHGSNCRAKSRRGRSTRGLEPFGLSREKPRVCFQQKAMKYLGQASTEPLRILFGSLWSCWCESGCVHKGRPVGLTSCSEKLQRQSVWAGHKMQPKRSCLSSDSDKPQSSQRRSPLRSGVLSAHPHPRCESAAEPR